MALRRIWKGLHFKGQRDLLSLKHPLFYGRTGDSIPLTKEVSSCNPKETSGLFKTLHYKVWLCLQKTWILFSRITLGGNTVLQKWEKKMATNKSALALPVL